MKKNSYSFKLTPEQQDMLEALLTTGNLKPDTVPHARCAAALADCRIVLYQSGKCLIQGKGAEDWVRFTLEPLVLQEAIIDYQEERNPESYAPHIGVDESGKGDYFGPLAVASVFTDRPTVEAFRALNVRDSKNIKSDKVIRKTAREIREAAQGRFNVVVIGPGAYNRLYEKMRNVNKLLAWGHAKAIENLLEKVPDCTTALSDKFGPSHRIEHALQQRGRKIKLVQKVRAESDPAVAAASILAREAFIDRMDKLSEQYHLHLPRGASAQTVEAARELVRRHGADALTACAKLHFKTTQKVLGS
jgi:ribonuclease HIII